MAVPEEVWIEWSPSTAVGAAPVWAPLAYPLRALWWKRGVKRAAAAVETGELVIVMDNRSRALDPTNRQSPLWPNVKPRRLIRVRYRQAGRTRTAFTGLISGWEPSWSLNSASVTISATDRRTLYTETPAPASAYASALASALPRWWWPMDEGGGPTAFNRGQDAAHAAYTNVNLQGGPLSPYGAELSASFGIPSSAGIAVVDAAGRRLGRDFTIAVIAKMDGPPSGYSAHAFAQGDGITLRVPSTGLPEFQVFQTGLVADFAGSGVNIATGTGHLLVARHGAGSTTLRVDNVQTTGTYAGRVPNGGALVLGNAATGLSPFTGRLSHLAVWDYALSDANVEALWSSYNFARQLETPAGRIGWILDEARDLFTRSLGEGGLELLGPYRGGLTIAAALDRSAATEGGLFLVDAEGRPTLMARYHQGRQAGIFSTNPGAGEMGLPALGVNMDTDGFFTTGRAEVATPEPITVEYAHGNAVAFGDVPWAPPSEFFSPEVAFRGAQRAVGPAEPTPHLTGAEHYATAETMADVLALEVWDSCTIKGYPPDDSGPGPFMVWGSGAFWATGAGWAGPGPIVQPSRILSAEVSMDFVSLTTTVRVDAEPSPAPLDLLTADEKTFDAGPGRWTGRTNASVGTAALTRTTVSPLTGAASGIIQAAAAGDVEVWLRGTVNPRGRGLYGEVSIRPATAGRACRLRLVYLSAAGAVVATVEGLATTTTPGEITRLSLPFYAVAEGAYHEVALSVLVVAAAAGEAHHIDDAQFLAHPSEVR